MSLSVTQGSSRLDGVPEADLIAENDGRGLYACANGRTGDPTPALD